MGRTLGDCFDGIDLNFDQITDLPDIFGLQNGAFGNLCNCAGNLLGGLFAMLRGEKYLLAGGRDILNTPLHTQNQLSLGIQHPGESLGQFVFGGALAHIHREIALCHA